MALDARVRTLLLVATLSAGTAGPLHGQRVDVVRDSVTISLVNTDIRGAIQAIGRYLTKPVLIGQLDNVRVDLFETPVAVHRDALPGILRGLIEANGLVFTEDSTFYRVTAPEPVVEEPAATQGATTPPTYQLFTVRLRHARAADIAATLNQLYGSGVDFSRPAGLSSGSLSQQLRADREGTAPPGDASDQGASLASQVRIVPDALTNALLIRATQGDYDVLQQGIAQLDVRPLQVLIEVIVVEARKDRQFFLGLDAQVPPQQLDGGTIEGELSGGGLGDLVIRVMSLSRAQINGAVSAARLRGDVQIISRPVLLASNNTEASLLVGTQQPFVQVSRSLPTETPQRDQVVQYRDVGTKLTVIPTINQDGYVSLFVQQEVSAATGDTQFNAPVISSREATTQVLIADRQTIVIGGLRDRIQEQSRTGIPLLADIPVLGALFGSTRTRSVETELFLFITPTIIGDDATMDRATIERVPERLRDSEFLRLGAVIQPDLYGCASGDPDCLR